jgi:conjugative relaxase-like TrwC/TraI family protein
MSVSAVGAGGADYYAKDDYYFGKAGAGDLDGAAQPVDGSTPLTWGGRGAARLGLEGRATLPDFQAVMGGRNPDPDGPALSVKDRRAREGQGPMPGEEANGRAEHRAGLDLTFSAPKSVSLAALVGGDERLLEAHAAAVGVVMGYIDALRSDHPCDLARWRPQPAHPRHRLQRCVR